MDCNCDNPNNVVVSPVLSTDTKHEDAEFNRVHANKVVCTNCGGLAKEQDHRFKPTMGASQVVDLLHKNAVEHPHVRRHRPAHALPANLPPEHPYFGAPQLPSDQPPPVPGSDEEIDQIMAGEGITSADLFDDNGPESDDGGDLEQPEPGLQDSEKPKRPRKKKETTDEK